MSKLTTSGIILLAVVGIVFTIPFFVYYGFSLDQNITISAIAVVVGIGVTIITTRYQSMAQQTTGLIKAFDLLNGPEQRDARRRVCKAYKPHTNGIKYSYDDFKNETLPKKNILEGIYDQDPINPLQKDVERVRADLDQIGSMIKHDLIPKDAFLEAYWNTTIRCWGALEGHIACMRNDIENCHFMTNFEDLKKDVLKYWKNKHKTEKIKYY